MNITDETKWNDVDIAEMRAYVAERRQMNREGYARLREYGWKMKQKGMIEFDKGRFYATYLWSRPRKEQETIKLLLNLQRNVTEQAMLLMEMEHAIDSEERKRNEKTGNTDIEKTS